MQGLPARQRRAALFFSLLLLCGTLASSPTAKAGSDVTGVIWSTHDSYLGTYASISGAPGDFDQEQKDSFDLPFWNESASASKSGTPGSSSASANQNTTVTTRSLGEVEILDGMSSSASVQSSATSANFGGPIGNGNSIFELAFDVQGSPVEYEMTVTLDASNNGDDDCARALVDLVDGSTIVHRETRSGLNCGTTPGPVGTLTGELPPDSYNLTAQALSEMDADESSFTGSASYSVTLEFTSLNCTITGSPEVDILNGTPEPDVICGLGGADEIDGFGGDDTIIGGPGNDNIFGGDDDDTLKGGGGTDTIHGGAGNDTLLGGGGDDGDPDLAGQLTAPGLYGGGGMDDLSGGGGFDILFGGGAKDTINANAGRSYMSGDAGEDVIKGGPMFDFADGGSGDDVIKTADSEDEARGGSGEDKIEGGDGPDTLIGGEDKDDLRGQAAGDFINSKDGTRDSVDGGSGGDEAKADPIDDVSGVENEHQ